MRPLRSTISITRAVSLALDAAEPIRRTERVGLDDAAGRVLASRVAAPADVPPFARAAMDGYAVRAADTAAAAREAPRPLRCVGTVFTGMVSPRAVRPGECIEIATGAPLPAGADAVVMVEETERDPGGTVRFFSPVRPHQNVSPRASDLAAGETVADAGEHVTPARLGALAAAGQAEVDVYARPAVAILSTGNEVVEVGRPLQAAEIYDVNRHTLTAVVRMHGGDARVLPRAPDTLEALTASLEAAAGSDLIVFSGGSSVGDRDLLLDAVAAAGEVIFHGIAVKPGKPTLLGRVRGRPLLGMPGNPTSCLSNAYLLLAPMLRRMGRLPAYRPQTLRVPLGRRIASAAGRHQFYTVRVSDGTAIPAFKSSGDITSMSRADGYIEIPADTPVVEAGEVVEVKLF